MKYATIPLPLTNFNIDIIIGGTKEEYSKFQINRYGSTKVEVDRSYKDECATIDSMKDSELKGATTFLIKLSKEPIDDISVFIHELWHLMWHISEAIPDLKLNYKTHTWGACMIERLSKLILAAKYINYE